METPNPETAPGNPPEPAAPSVWRRYRRPLVAALAAVILAGAAVAVWMLRPSAHIASVAPSVSPSPSAQFSAAPAASSAPGLQLDPNKNYGDQYANGILPVGDGKYSTTAASVGTIYACAGYAHNLQNSQGGAGRRGPWFIGTTQYDLNKKDHVSGQVSWQPRFDMQLMGSLRTIATNNLPNHYTGIFPIRSTDPAYAYDRNPNSIQSQNYTYNLPANPAYGQPGCMGGQAGVMLTGVALFNGFDAAGRDAGAWEVQDNCDGHPEKTGEYHYHTLSSCIKDTSVSTVIGFALDGFPITGPQVGKGNILTTADLDECHGLTSRITLDGKSVTMYHYVMTQDFPYSVSCFRGQAIQPPGQTARP